MKKYRFALKGLSCPNCARKIEDNLKKNAALKNVNVNFANLTLSFEADGQIDINRLVIDIVKKIEPNVKVIDSNKKVEEEKESKINKDIVILIIGVILAGLSFVIKANVISTICIIFSYVL